MIDGLMVLVNLHGLRVAERIQQSSCVLVGGLRIKVIGTYHDIPLTAAPRIAHHLYSEVFLRYGLLLGGSV